MFFILTLNVFCIFLMMVPGAWAGRKNWISQSGVLELSNLLVRFIYPCLIFSSIIQNFSLKELLAGWTLPATAFGMMFLGYMISLLISIFLKFSTEQEQRAFLFQSTLNNYSFLPLPLVLAFFGDRGVAALIFSSLGAEFALWTLGVFILTGHRFSWNNVKHLLSPPLVALYAAVLLRVFLDKSGAAEAVVTGKNSPAVFCLLNTIRAVGSATIPLAMIIAGARIAALKITGFNNARLWILTSLRLVFIPLAAILLLQILPLPQDVKQIMTIVAVMPVAIASFIFSEIYGGDKDFINSSVLLTHMFSLITIPVLLALFLKL